MSNLSTTIATGFVNQYTDFGVRVHRLAEDLSEEQFWTKPHSYGNSFGNLVLHITGNLNYYVGAQIAQTGYFGRNIGIRIQNALPQPPRGSKWQLLM